MVQEWYKSLECDWSSDFLSVDVVTSLFPSTRQNKIYLSTFTSSGEKYQRNQVTLQQHIKELRCDGHQESNVSHSHLPHHLAIIILTNSS